MLASVAAEQLGTGSLLSGDAPDAKIMRQIPLILQPAVKATLKEVQKLVHDIIDSDAAKVHKQFGNALKSFTTAMTSLGITVSDAHGGDIKKLAEYTKQTNARLKKMVSSLVLPDKEKEKTLQIHWNLDDYQGILYTIATQRPSELQYAMSKIDTNDLLESLYGTILALSCITALAGKKKYDRKKLTILLNIGSKYSENLNSYTDTIDILSNPKEREELAQTEKRYRERYPDYPRA